MKQLILILLLVIAAQPLPASLCVMHMGQIAQQVMDVDESDSDCCNQQQPGSSDSCDPVKHCGAANAGVAVLDSNLDSSPVFTSGCMPSFQNGPLSPSFDLPPYRPPIS